MRRVDVDGRAFLVCNAFGKYYAINPVCPHEDGPLEDGSLIGDIVTCPVHGYDFDVRTGECRFDSDYRVETYPVRVVQADLYVELP
jgi:nitrite reductase/ring-hydroxylating ferredoxin subunit